VRGLAQLHDQLCEGDEFGSAGTGNLRDRRVQAAAGGFRRILQVFQAARADAARGEVHHAGEGVSSSVLAIRRR
jgi:hypothetical protein